MKKTVLLLVYISLKPISLEYYLETVENRDPVSKCNDRLRFHRFTDNFRNKKWDLCKLSTLI